MPNLIEPCSGCGAILDCGDENPFSSYSLQERFGEVTGFSLNDGATLRFQCCNQVLTAQIPYGTDGDERLSIVRNMAAQCRQMQQFCDRQTTIPQGDPGGGTIPDQTTIPQVFWNDPQTCVVNCPDGTPFVYTVQPGLYGAFTKSAANTMAYAAACQLARFGRICLGSLRKETCANVSYVSKASITHRNVPIVASIVSGAIPTGMVLTYNNTSFTISGTPTVPGLYSFTVRVQDGVGNHQQKAYTICVVDIRWDTEPYGTVLDDAEEGEEYSVTFNAPSCAVAPLSWQVSAGVLPAGITLNEQTGVLSGTPTETGSFNFTIKVQTAST